MLGWQIQFAPATMEHRDLMPHFRKPPDQKGPDETRSADDQNPHDFRISFLQARRNLATY
jgi:hypothetical protein